MCMAHVFEKTNIPICFFIIIFENLFKKTLFWKKSKKNSDKKEKTICYL